MQNPVSDDSLLNGQARLASQMSVLPADASSLPCHWFTATADPALSLFKPFIFCDGASIGDKTRCPVQHSDDREEGSASSSSLHAHPLWKAHQKFVGHLEGGDSRAEGVLQNMKELGTNCLDDLEEVMRNGGADSTATTSRVASLFQHMVDLEMNFY